MLANRTEVSWGGEIKRGLSQAKRAGDGIRTHDNNVGNVVLYQLSYTRKLGGWLELDDQYEI